MRLIGHGLGLCAGRQRDAIATGPYVNNIATSDPVRYARTKAVLEAAPELGIGSPTVSWLDAAYRAMGEIADPSYASKIRQPLHAGRRRPRPGGVHRRRSRTSPCGCAPART